MSNIVARCDSLSAKIANLRQAIRGDAKLKKAPKLDFDDKVDEEVQKQRDKLVKKNGGQPADEALIDQGKAVEKAKKRKDSQSTTPPKPTPLCNRVLKTVEKKRNGKQVEKLTSKLKYPLRIPKSPIAR